MNRDKIIRGNKIHKVKNKDKQIKPNIVTKNTSP